MVQYRVKMPHDGAFISILVNPDKKYGDKYGYELIEEHKSAEYTKAEIIREDIGCPPKGDKYTRHECAVCGGNCPNFIWATDRYFNRFKLADICVKDLPSKVERRIYNESYTVCTNCVEEHGLMK